MFPLNGWDLSERSSEFEKILLAKGYPVGTIVYRAEYYPGVFPYFIISIILAKNNAHLVFSSNDTTVDQIEMLLRQLDGDTHEPQDEDNRGKRDAWIDQTRLSKEDIDFVQQEMAKLDPFTITDLYRRPILAVDGITLFGYALKAGEFSAHEFGLHPQPPDPDVIRSKTYFDKMLELAAFKLPDYLSQRCIAELQKYLT